MLGLQKLVGDRDETDADAAWAVVPGRVGVMGWEQAWPNPGPSTGAGRWEVGAGHMAGLGEDLVLCMRQEPAGRAESSDRSCPRSGEDCILWSMEMGSSGDLGEPTVSPNREAAGISTAEVTNTMLPISALPSW